MVGRSNQNAEDLTETVVRWLWRIYAQGVKERKKWPRIWVNEKRLMERFEMSALLP